jgi:hypothetical protein
MWIGVALLASNRISLGFGNPESWGFIAMNNLLNKCFSLETLTLIGGVLMGINVFLLMIVAILTMVIRVF